MSSPSQVAANRQNALHSTGPRSDEGKATSAANALAHGLSEERPVLPGESAQEWDAFHTAVLAPLAPADALEAPRAERVALGQ